MKRDGMKIGLLVVLVAASGILYYNGYVRTPPREPVVFTPAENEQFEHGQRVHQALIKSAGYEDAGS